MQTKLTLRLEKALLRKAKRLARRKGSSISKIFSDCISKVDSIAAWKGKDFKYSQIPAMEPSHINKGQWGKGGD